MEDLPLDITFEMGNFLNSYELQKLLKLNFNLWNLFLPIYRKVRDAEDASMAEKCHILEDLWKGMSVHYRNDHGEIDGINVNERFTYLPEDYVDSVITTTCD